MSDPNVFDYRDHRQFLGAWFAEQKRLKPRFSHGQVARYLGTSDRSVLRAVISGRRSLGLDRARSLLPMLRFTEDEAEYFLALVEFNESDNRADRDRALRQLLGVRTRARATPVEGDLFLFMSSWRFPAVRGLVDCLGFREDPEWIASRLGNGVTPDQAEEALAVIERLGLVERREDRLVTAEPVYHTDSTVTRMASLAYHRELHELARDALDRLLGEDRAQGSRETGFLAMTMAIPEDDVPELRRMIHAFQFTVAAWIEERRSRQDRVYQLNFDLFPLSRNAREG